MAFGMSAVIFIGVRVFTLVMSGINLGRTIHKKMIKSLLYASILNFYNRVPIGRVLNRLSKDLREVDEAIGYSIGNFLVSIFSLLSNLIICFYASTPYVVIPMALIAFLCYRLQNYYLKTQRECVRLENITTSPIVSGFTSTINGLATVRSYGL